MTSDKCTLGFRRLQLYYLYDTGTAFPVISVKRTLHTRYVNNLGNFRVTELRLT